MNFKNFFKEFRKIAGNQYGIFGDVGKAISGAVNAVNPFDGNNGKGLGGWAEDMARATTGPLGPFGVANGLNGYDMLKNSFSGGGLFGKPQSSGGGGDGMAQALMHQADMGYKSALAGADAAKYAADKQYALGQSQVEAQLQSSKMAMAGGIVGAAMAAQQDTTVRKQLLPHEAGAATVLSHEFASKWNKSLQMRVAGYNDTAIRYEMGGRNWKTLFDDSTWNALKMRQEAKADTLQSMQLFGVKSDTNPHGIDMSIDDFYAMHTFKDPEEMLKVDPAEAEARNKAYAQWAQKMRSEGNGMIVDMFENPQLAGEGIMTMRGKDPIIDPRLKPFLEMATKPDTSRLEAQRDSELAELDKMKPEWRHMSHNSPGMGNYYDASGNMITDRTDGGRKISAKDTYNQMMDKYYKQKRDIENKYNKMIGQGQKDATDWNQAWNALTKGEQNKHTEEIKRLQKEGVIDKYGMINAGELEKRIPPEFLRPPAFSTHKELTPDMKRALDDQYNKLAEMKIDEKLVRNVNMGGGYTKKMLLNPDGSRAATVMTGQGVDAMGNPINITLATDNTQDMYTKLSRISGLAFSHMSKGYAAPADPDIAAGNLKQSSTWNYMAKSSSAPAKAPGTTNTLQSAPSPAMKSAIKPTASPTAAGIAPLEPGDD